MAHDLFLNRSPFPHLQPRSFPVMAAPNIEMIAASLRNCNLGRVAAAASPPPPLPPMGEDPSANGQNAAEAFAATVELNSEISLPYQWEQCLDLKTGKIYYINWADGTKTTKDPRGLSTSCSVEDDGEDFDADTSENDGDSSDDNGGFSSSFFSSSSSSSSPSSSSDSTQQGRNGRGPVLVAAGCTACMMFYMLPKRSGVCPTCGELLLNFGRSANSKGNCLG